MENKKGNLPWYMTDTVGIEFGPTGAAVDDEHYMERMTGADIVEKAVKANAEYLILFCKDSGYAYYKSKYRPLPPGLAGRDLLREVCDAAAGKNMHVIAYSCVQYDATALREHPEWNQLDDRGRKLNHLCLRNPEYTEYMKGVIDELAMYPIDGFHIDMLNLGFGEPCGCWCENCKTAFKDEYGYEMPAKFDLDDPAFRDAFEFRYSNNNKMCSELEAHVKRNYPRLSIDFNYHGSPPFSYESGQRPVQHAAFGDFLTAESLPWIFGYNNIAMITRFLCAANRDKPYQVVSSRSIYNYHEYTLRPTEDMRYEVMCIIANGGTFTMVDKAGYDGWFDDNVYTRLSSVFAEARRKAGIARGHKRAQVGCAVYFSQKTRDFVYREKMYDYHNSIAGLCRMLSQEHIDYTFIFDENVTPEKLAEYPLAILPDTGIISRREAELFENYVSGGGNLFAFGGTGVFDGQGKLSDTCAVDKIFGVEYTGVANGGVDNYLVFPARSPVGADKSGEPDETEKIAAGFEEGYCLYVRDRLFGYRPFGASVYGEAMIGFRPRGEDTLSGANSDIWNQLMSPGIHAGGAVYYNNFGSGKAVLIPISPARAYMGSHRSPELRKLTANIIRMLTPECAIKMKAPLNTEAVVTSDENSREYMVRLVTYNPTQPALSCHFGNDRRHFAPIMEEPALYKAEIYTSFAIKSAESVDGTPLKIDGDKITFTTDRVYEIIKIKY